MKSSVLVLAFLITSAVILEGQDKALMPPTVASIESSEIADFDNQPEEVKKLIESALDLTRENLGYKYGSSDPSQGGMDCSGTIFHLLKEAGLEEVPRSSDEQYKWVRKAGKFRAVLSAKIDSFELDDLRPGDLMFWTGTYEVKRDIPITHTMIYLGKAKSDGLPLMVGASDGRSYRGKKCFGVSVFEFKAPARESKSRFVGYAHIPGLIAANKP